MNAKSHQSILSAQVANLIDRAFKRSPISDTLLDGAIEFYAYKNDTEDDKSVQGNNDNEQKTLLARKKVEQGIKSEDFQERLQSERIARHELLTNLCFELLELTEGDNFDETNRKSAQVLGTIQLLSYTEGSKVAPTNELHKPLYKAVLTIRLLDRLLIDDKVKDSYIKQFMGEITPEQYYDFKTIDEAGYNTFLREVKIPFMMAALLQDIGNYHPDAQHILIGPDENLDPYRMLNIDDRKKLLQINYRETLRYLVEGIGAGIYLGNTRKGRDEFNQQEQRKLKFIKELLKNAVNPKQGLGNVIKVPQIYTSIVLSTKTSYVYKLTPKVFQALQQNAERGNCCPKVVNSLYQITGMFPQGFGVTYLAVDAAGNSLERYEYAIVNSLYPNNPEEPHCRIATRQLSFIGYGTDKVVYKAENLYFAESARRLASMSKARLQEILEKLVSNYQERAELDLIPRCWHPRDFFSVKTNQKLWNKSQ